MQSLIATDSLTASIRALPWEQAERFNFRAHAQRRAALIGAHVVSLPCPATKKWIVVPTLAMARDFRAVFVQLRSHSKAA